MFERTAFDPTRIRAVVFDAYGTLLVNKAASDYWFAKELIERQSIRADHEALEQSIRDAWSRASPWALAKPWTPGATIDPAATLELQLNGPLPKWRSAWAIWRRQYELAFEDLGLDGDPDDAANYLRDFLADLDAYPDAHSTLERLASAGLVLGLLSNADEDFLQRALSRARLRFSAIQSSESLRVYKPHRAAFTAMCTRLNCAPAQVLYVGDSPTADVLGAKNAGLRTAWVRRESLTWPDNIPRPDLEVSALIEVAEAFTS